MKKWLFSAASLLALGAAIPAQAITVDGLAGDWGITVQNGPLGGGVGSVYAPSLPSYAGAGAGPGLLTPINPHLEDTDDRAPITAPLGPQGGGQKYDAQYMAVALNTPVLGTLSTSTLYILISSGMRPDNTTPYFGIGDIRITAGTGSFGIETGGGAGPAVLDGSAGNNFDLAGNGATISMVATPGFGQAGTLFKTAAGSNWLMDPLPVDGPPPENEDDRNQLNYGVGGVTIADIIAKGVGDVTLGGPHTVEYHYTGNTLTNAGDGDDPGDQNVHSLIEISMPASYFVATDVLGNEFLVFDITWGPACNNDIVHIEVSEIPRLLQTPEPGTLALLGLGLAAVGGIPMWRRRRSA